MTEARSNSRLNQFFRISRALAGQLDFLSAIRSVAAEVAEIVPYDHLDVCIVRPDGKVITAYETGIDTAWGNAAHAPVAFSPIRALLVGEVDHILTDDATTDPRFHFPGAFARPIHEHSLRARIHAPMIVHGEVIGAVSVSRHEARVYRATEARNVCYLADLLAPYFYAIRATEQAHQSTIVEAEARAREEGLRLGARRLTEALEAERQRIGMDLHDQTLADLTRLTRRLERLAQRGGAEAAEVRSIAAGLHTSMAALRQIIEEAKPSVLQLFGFAEAVENHLDRAIRDSGQGIAGGLVDDSVGAFDHLPAATSVTLLRIVQEAINNAVAHADARRIDIHLSSCARQVTLEVTDDGKGRDPTERRTGAGIDNMRTRARLVGGRFSLGAGPRGVGTAMRVVLAVSEAEEAAGLAP